MLSAATFVACGALLLLSLLAFWNLVGVVRARRPLTSWPVESLAAATVLLALVLQLLPILEGRALLTSRSFSLIRVTTYSDALGFTRFAERGVPLLAWLGLVFALARGSHAAAGHPRRFTLLTLFVAAGLAQSVAWSFFRKALLAFVGKPFEVPLVDAWQRHFDATRPLLTRSAVLVGISVLVLGVLVIGGTLRGAPKERPSRQVVAMQGVGIALLLTACIGVWRATQPFVAEVTSPLPTDHQFTNCSLCVWSPPRNEGTGPDALAEGPVVSVVQGKPNIDGIALADEQELFNVLKNKRELYKQAHPSETKRDFVFLLDAAPTERVDAIERTFDAAWRAGFSDVRLMLTHRLKMDRAWFGKLVGFRGSTIRVELVPGPALCQGGHVVPRERDGAAPYASLLQRLLALRLGGEQVCKLVEPSRGEASSLELEARRVQIAAVEFEALLVRVPNYNTEVRYLDRHAARIGSLGKLRREVESQGLELVMGMNAGMFTPDYAPVGLLRVRGKELGVFNPADGEGNFFLKPNGVASIDSDGFVSVGPRRDAEFATQSGPLLLERSHRHPAVRADSKSRHLRNAVCTGGRRAAFVISRQEVTFHELTLALEQLGCDDGLYLDGTISKMYAPLLGRFDDGGDFGPMLAVVRVKD